MTGVLGGGVIFVVAALLWAAVLVPSWARRREFRAAERNAVRLQRTLRVLAETAEVPDEVRVEATAREALAQERLLRTAQKRQEAERQARLAEARADQVQAEMRAQQMRRRQTAATRSAKLRKPIVRRLRAASALLALLALAAVLIGVGFLVAGQGYTVLVSAGLCLAAAVGALMLMAPGRARHVPIAAEQIVRAAEPALEATVGASAFDEGAEAGTSAAAHAAAQLAAAARIERARSMARARAERPESATMQNQTQSILLRQVARDEALRAPRTAVPAAAAPVAVRAQPVSGASSAAQHSQRLAQAERLRRMGVVGDTSDGMLDLDAALRQRRSAG